MSSTTLSTSLSFLMVCFLVSGLPSRPRNYVDSLTRGDSQTLHECKQLESTRCAEHFSTRDRSWYAQFPNPRGLNANQSINEFRDFSLFLDLNNYCSHMLYALLCFHYFPHCSPLRPELAVMPCQEVCREAMEACLPIARALLGNENLHIPLHLECYNFESKESEVLRSAESNGSSVPLACPNATIHLDFFPPAGKIKYEVLENAGNLEVCLTLANVGSYNSTVNLDTPVTVKLTAIETAKKETTYPPATVDVDYGQLSATVMFPVGSSKWDKQCVNVSIIDNDIINSDKSFSVKAVVVSPGSAKFGGPAQSNSGNIEVIIKDDDGATTVDNNVIRVDFKQSLGRVEIEEDRGYVEVCLNLTSTGNAVLDLPITVNITTLTTDTAFVPAQPELDYIPISTSLEFPVNSVAGVVKCVNVTVVMDGLVEPDESFSVQASISDPSIARFGSESLVTSGSIEVIIRDDDECMIMGNHCKRNCDMRDKANKGIFKHNCYTYAAHVEILSRKNLEGCSVLNVFIISCWELQEGACATNASRLSIPVCPNCMTDFTAGNEYVIAGLHDSEGMFIPNYKKGGLFGVWDSNKYSSMNEWVQIGIDYQLHNDTNSCSE